MSTPQPPSREQAPADPNRSWLQQPETPPSSQPPQPQTFPAPPQPQQTPSRAPAAGQPSVTDALHSIKPTDFLTFHQAPCSRSGLLTGIGAGAAIGAVRWIMGLPIPRAANWAVGTGALAAMGQYEYCQFRRRQEREKMKRVVEVYQARTARERKEKEAEGRERRAKEEREREEKERARGGWKFW
ncbi:cytochrome oxidase biogenesis protein, Cox20 subunit [Trichocladium antarcticum]|uniref:Cytochrome c oxidase assembly protein COX20, mitochondrial n=1 Tax=Trichocladium antarcticum TaxID=1450529 RepID=A0AAN6ZCR9_9PEZI|nr:cytochrome oxidase biogenesis protein, Cox20 subunit [Trichocladium antarcticum]